MTNSDDETNIIIVAVHRLLISSFLSCLAFAVFFTLYPTGQIIDSVIPSLGALTLFIVLLYLHYNPNTDINKIIVFYIIFFILTFSPATLFYVWMAWQDKWRLIDEFPPITGLVMAVIMLGVVMLPRQYQRCLVIMWACVALPILHYLAFHPEELRTPRGYEMIGTFGPASLLLYIVFPHQKNIHRHINKVTGDLRRYESEAERDYLTDTYNRRGLIHWLNKLSPEDQISVLLIDIDHFKSVNDHFGHGIGDRILVEVASRLRSVYFEKHLIARWGGEEFAVILINPKTNVLPYIGSMFQHSLSTLPYQVVGKITVSVGVSGVAQHNRFAELIEQADTALYAAKHNGRDQSVFFPAL